MKKLGILIAIVIVATTVYAGVNYINYKTGEFQCTNGYTSTISSCTPDGLSSSGYAFCQSQVAEICNH